MNETLGGRAYGHVYHVTGRRDLHEFLVEAVERSGGVVLYASRPDRAPVYLGVQTAGGDRIGLLVYPFRITRKITRNRPADEVRGQIRYGSEESWLSDHPLSRDPARIDVTLVCCLDIEDDLVLGLDPLLYDPLPMGISVFAKQAHVDVATSSGWHVWEKVNRPGKRRTAPRSPSQLETLVMFKPERLLDFARFERESTALRLDPALRYVAARNATDPVPEARSARHALEEQFALSSQEILDIIGGRNRLSVAVRGGVAEHHLERFLRQQSSVQRVERLDADAMHDFNVTMSNGVVLRIECKNVSPRLNKDGDFKVELQKTRASKGDPASRLYSVSAFDAVAACLFSATGTWSFRFQRTESLPRSTTFPDRLAPMQYVDRGWVDGVKALATPAPAQI